MAEIKRRSEAFSRIGSPQRMMATNARDTARLADLRIAEVKPDPGNPRKEFDQAELQELAGSLKKHGLLQPIVVRKIEDDYIILAGERRWRAAQLAQFISIKAVVHSDSRTAANVLIAQIIENEQRAALSTAELVSSIGRLLADGLGVQEIADELSMNRTRVSKLKALTELPEELRPFLATTGIDPLYEMLQQHRADADSLKSAIETGKAPTRAELREAKRPPAAAPDSPTLPIDDPAQLSDGQAKLPARDTFAGERDPALLATRGADTFAGERRPRGATPSYRDQGSITVKHPEHGEGRVVFGLATEGDRLPVIYGNASEPISTHLAELSIVATS